MGLETKGKKAVLRERLMAAIKDNEDEDENNDEDKDEKDDEDEGEDSNEDEDESDDEDEDENDDEEEDKKRKKKSADRKSEKRSINTVRGTDRNVRFNRQTTLSFIDVEDALETFSGDGSENIHRWLINLEETAELC